MNGAPGAIVRGHLRLMLGPSLEPRTQTIDFLFPLLVVLPELSQLGASTDGVDRIPRVRFIGGYGIANVLGASSRTRGGALPSST